MRYSTILLLGLIQCLFCNFSIAEDISPYQEMTVAREGQSYRYRLLRPTNTTAKFPLVLFLHGAGERGTDNSAQLKFLPTALATPELREKFPCFVLAPQCAPDQQWVNAPWGAKQCSPMAAAPSVMLANAIAALEQTRKDPQVDPTRIYLTGISMGGFGTWELAMRHPEWFAAAAPVCGGGDEANAALLKAVPLWAFHGGADTVVWPERSQRMIDAISASGGKPKFTLLPGVGHNAWDQAYALPSGLLEWLFTQRKLAQ
jgi:predicted peptidase